MVASYSESQRVRGVEVFCVGEHRGKPYDERDLKDIVDNFNRYSVPKNGRNPLLQVPAVLGHEEDQDALERSDLPAAGWPKALWVENKNGLDGITRPTLMADIGEMNWKVAQALKQRKYRKVSAEIYDDPPDGVPGKGKMLRRIAFLGGDIPQVKPLDDIPAPEPEPHHERWNCQAGLLKFSEVRPSKSAKTYWVFSEVTPMFDRKKMAEQLKGAGLDTTKFTDTMPTDEVMAEMCRYVDTNKPEPDELPDPKTPEEKAAYAEKSKKYAAKCGLKFADEPPVEPGKTDDKNRPGGAFEEKPGEMPDPTKKPAAFSEWLSKTIASRVDAGVKKGTAEFEKFSEEARAGERKRGINAFCETHLKAGRLTPKMLDDSINSKGEKNNPYNVIDRLYRTDSKSIVTTFSEHGKKLELTALDLAMREIAAGPILFKFAEVVGSDGKMVDNNADPKKAREEFAKTTFQKFSEHFKTAGVKEDQFVKQILAEDDDDFAKSVKRWNDRAAA
jgi:hypothetical protein